MVEEVQKMADGEPKPLFSFDNCDEAEVTFVDDDSYE